MNKTPSENTASPLARKEGRRSLPQKLRLPEETPSSLARGGGISHRLWSRVKKGNQDQCWEWTGRTENGYGKIKIMGRHYFTHRVALVLSGTPIEDGDCVLHRCDNPPCCNPDHLFIGTRVENRADCVTKNRHAKGERNGHAKVTPEIAAAIRREYVPRKVSGRVLGEKYGLSISGVFHILNNETWN